MPWTHCSPQGSPDPGRLAPFQQILDPLLIYHNYHGLMHPGHEWTRDPDVVKMGYMLIDLLIFLQISTNIK